MAAQLASDGHVFLLPTRPHDRSRSHRAWATLGTTASIGALAVVLPVAIGGGRDRSPGSALGIGGSIGSGSPTPGVPVGRSAPVSVGRIPLISVREVSLLGRPPLSTKPAASTVRVLEDIVSGRMLALVLVTPLGPRVRARSQPAAAARAAMTMIAWRFDRCALME